MQFIKRHSKLLIVIFILGAIAVSIVYLLVRPEQASTPPAQETDAPAEVEEAPGPAVDVPDSSSDVSVATPGAYVDYSDTAFAQAQGRRIIFFHAPWCPQCRELDASIRSTTLPDNMTILKTDYDTSRALRQQYGVTLQTTLVEVDAQGNAVKSFVAYDTPTFDAVRQEFNL